MLELCSGRRWLAAALQPGELWIKKTFFLQTAASLPGAEAAPNAVPVTLGTALIAINALHNVADTDGLQPCCRQKNNRNCIDNTSPAATLWHPSGPAGGVPGPSRSAEHRASSQRGVTARESALFNRALISACCYDLVEHCYEL